MYSVFKKKKKLCLLKTNETKQGLTSYALKITPIYPNNQHLKHIIYRCHISYCP